MSKEAIEELAQAYLKGQSITFSEAWRRKLVKRVVILQDKQAVSLNELTEGQRTQIEIDIETIHGKMFLNLSRVAEKWLKSKYRILDNADVEIIVGDAFAIWWETFDPDQMPDATNPEFSYLWVLTWRKASNYVKKNYPTIYKDKKNGRKLSAVNVPLDEVDNLIDLKNYFDNDEKRRDADAEREDIDKQFINNEELYSRPVKFGKDFFPYFSFAEVFKYYWLTQKLVYADSNNKLKARVVHEEGKPVYTEIIQPKIEHQRDNESQVIIHEEQTTGSHPFEIGSINNTATYYRRRWEILRSIVW